MYDGTSTEQKTKNAKSAVSSILTALFKPYRQHFVLPPPFINKRRQIGWMYLAWFRGFIGSLKSPPKITENFNKSYLLNSSLEFVINGFERAFCGKTEFNRHHAVVIKKNDDVRIAVNKILF